MTASLPNKGDEVVIVGDSTLQGQTATVVEREPRMRGPRTTVNRYDYKLLVSNGRHLWFEDVEIRHAP